MSEEEIKSPLPPRKPVFESSEEETGPRVSLNLSTQTTDTSASVNVGPISPIKNKKIIKWLLIGLLTVVGLLIIYGIYSKWLKNKNIGFGTKTTINYWGLWEEESVINGVIADYEAENPNIKVEYKKNIKDGYRGRLSGRLSKSGNVDDVPDVFRIHNTWIPMFRDNLAPVPTDVANKIALDSDFFDVYKKDLKENGNYLSIPTMYDGLVMFYNPELLQTAQVNVPNNWWDFKRSAIKITQKSKEGKILVAGAAMGTTENVEHWSDIIGLMMKQNGVDFSRLSESNQKKIKDVLNFYTLFKTDDQVWDETLPNAIEFFANGKLGFYFGPSWRAFDIQALNPDLKFETAAVPQLPTNDSVPTDKIDPGAELTNIHWASYWSEGVNNKSAHQKEAWKFLEYLTSPAVLEKWYQTDSQIRSFGQIYPRKSMADKISSNAKLAPFVNVANNASSWYLAAATWDDGLNTEMQKYFKDAINGILNNRSDNEDTITKTLINGVSQLKQKYNLTR